MANNLSPKHICFNELPKILYNSRSWHREQQYKHPMHPVIQAAFAFEDPKDYAQLCLEWPYEADMDKTRIAYTQDDRAAEADRQTVTTVGKYLKRHFPTMADHTIRDLVAKYATASEFSVSDSSADIIDAVQEGPPSCMQWQEHQIDDVGCHPYAVYAPKYGWAIAMRKDGRQINGRALVMQREQGGRNYKYFVRTYQRPSDTCSRYSAPDEQLHQWLLAQGYTHRNSWSGEKIAYIESSLRNMDFVAPYIDGSAQCVSEGYDSDKRTKYLVISDSGDYECCSTGGGYESNNSCTCEDCDSRIDEDDSYSVGYHGDRTVGQCCIDNYTMAIGRRGESYYVPEDEAVEVDGDWYDRDYLGEHDIVRLHDGEYAPQDETVYIESESDYYRSDDSDVVEDHNNEWQLRDDCVELANGDWALSDDTWCCESSGEYYLSDDVDAVTIHGLTFHPDTTAEDIAAAINAKTGQSNLFVPAVTPAERAAVMAPIVVAAAEPEVLMRGTGGGAHLVRESLVSYFLRLHWTLVEPEPLVTAYPQANSVYETI